MEKTILILGGYGKVGKSLTILLLRRTSVNLIVGGRRAQKVHEFCTELTSEYPEGRIAGLVIDVHDKVGLNIALEGVDMVIMAVPDISGMENVVRAAIPHECDYLDLFYGVDSLRILQFIADDCEVGNLLLISQAGCHPGLVAPMIRHTSFEFDKIEVANVFLSVNPLSSSNESLREIVNDSYDFQPAILVDGAWQKQKLGSSRSVDFGEPAGIRKCIASPMPEIRPLYEELGIPEIGTYVSGFNWFVDTFIFGMLFLVGRVKKGLGINLFQRAFKWGIKRFSPSEEWIIFRLEATSSINNRMKDYVLVIRHSDGNFLTAACVCAMIEQYQKGIVGVKGVQMMGSLVDPKKFMSDLMEMGIDVEVSFNIDNQN